MKRIFWDYRRSFLGTLQIIIGIPIIAPMLQRVAFAPAIIIATLVTAQYGLTSHVYYDEYEGGVSDFVEKH